jgi:hypothetical protein
MQLGYAEDEGQGKSSLKTESVSYRLLDGKHPQKRVLLLNEIRYLVHQTDINGLPIQSYLDAIGKMMRGYLLLDHSGTDRSAVHRRLPERHEIQQCAFSWSQHQQR